MRILYLIISYVLHPLYIPFAGTLAYFLITPKHSPFETQSSIITPIFILTVIIPVIVYLIFQNLAITSTLKLPNFQHRKYSIYLILALLLLVLFRITPYDFTIELHFYFMGLIAALLCALLLLFLKFKCSLHLLGMGSILMFLIHLSIHYEKNLIVPLSIITFLSGLLATSRLYLNPKRKAEVLIGFLLGICTQLFTIKFWL